MILKQKLLKYFLLKEKEIGEYARIDRNGMHFCISVYDVKSSECKTVGNLCVIEMKALFGLMKMKSEVFTPLGIDAPMFSKDIIRVARTTTLLLEVYDTMIGEWNGSELEKVKASGEDIPNYNPGTHWYDSIRFPCSSFKKGKNIQKKIEAYEERYSEVYTEGTTGAQSADPMEKKKKTSAYVEQLIENGGPAVNQFMKMLGEEKTKEFLRKYMFASI